MQLERLENIIAELHFQTSRSGGKGGQHVNKTETKVHLFFNVRASDVLTPEEKNIIVNKAGTYLSHENVIQMTCDTARSQLANRNEVIQRFSDWLVEVLKPVKTRKKTRVPKDEKRKRLEHKKIQSSKKQLRKPPSMD